MLCLSSNLQKMRAAELELSATKKVKDMNSDHACMKLQDLWEEVEIRFDDLSWLEPHNAAKVKKLKANVVDLEEKTKTLKAEIITRHPYFST
ncbi:hypothetical protein Ahy_B01g055059 [Arachis hypogaea]|uniref:Uncharacterized protein n=1 Tax=Arachis hypogaea TaxID=3818 RepID=A0A445AUX8_ARAHY|nr:hypothetical protein Ahy_B01g055059 [Arachis hypogaea]